MKGFDGMSEANPAGWKRKSTNPIIFFSVFASGVIALCGLFFGVGYLVGKVRTTSSTNGSQRDYLADLKSDVDPMRIKNHLKFFTTNPHMAGTEGNKKTADYVLNNWNSQGLDKAQMLSYDVLLSYPHETLTNNVEVFDSNNTFETKYDVLEVDFDNSTSFANVSKPFLAYGLNGSVNSDELYFANYCRDTDFNELLRQGFNVSGKIVLCKYGKIFRGNKVAFCEAYGAAGCIIYDDPKRSAGDGQNLYPDGEFLPDSGTQRGSLFLKRGDPMTPDYPSTEYVFRNRTEADMRLPKIPAQCIGYRLALELFNLMDHSKSKVVPYDWQGDLTMTYSFGGKLKDSKSLTLNVFNQRKVSKIWNVIGMIEGSSEPDRYVIIGNHRDAWTYGAVDPNSGTSALLEISRVLMDLKKNKGWRPKRSVMFLSHDAEEYGLIGSFEFVEELKKKLSANGVVYLNMDSILKGNYSYRAVASPLLFELLFNVTKSIEIAPGESVFNRWIKNAPNADNTAPNIKPHMGSGSDHAGFQQQIGLPCIEQNMVRNKDNVLFINTELTTYPLYHSGYDTFKLVSEFLDPTFETTALITLIISELSRQLSDSVFLPFNVNDYAVEMMKELDKLKVIYQADFPVSDLLIMEYAIGNFTQVAKDFHNRLDKIDRNNVNLVRVYNDQLRNLEKAFLDVNTGIKRAGFEHTVFAPSVYNLYGGTTYTPITDAIFVYKQSSPLSEELKNDIAKQISITAYSIYSAASILRDPLDFQRYYDL